MNFQKDPKIEELLNSYIDGELSSAEAAEVQRLVNNDKGIARRLRELEKCQLLVSSLPPAEPSAEVVSGIKRLLRNRLAGADSPAYARQTQGARHLFARQVLAAAVMIGLVGLLGAVIYKIVAPAGPTQPLALQPTVKTEAAPAETKKVVAAEVAADVGIYSLRLATADFAAVDAFINKLLAESTWLKYETSKEQPGRSVYSVYCSRSALEGLMTDLAPAWSKFDSAKFVVHTEDIGRSVTIEQVRPEQITDVVKKDTLDGRVKLAKDFAVLNNVEQVMSDRQMLAIADRTYPELTAIPKPVLTSGERKTTAVPQGAYDKLRVDLTIVVSAHK